MSNIEIKGLRIQRGLRDIIAQFDLKVEAGTSVVIHGANGSGKTTLLRALAGLMPIAEGKVSINGHHYEEDRISIHQSIIYIGHRDGFSGSLTAHENLKLWAQSKGHEAAEIKARVENSLSALGMDDFAETPLYTMSEGQRKRCGLARLSLSQNLEKSESIWLLDEPLTALDQVTAATLAKLIDHHTEQGGIAILSSHQDISLKRSQKINLDKFSLSIGGQS